MLTYSLGEYQQGFVISDLYESRHWSDSLVPPILFVAELPNFYDQHVFVLFCLTLFIFGSIVF